MPAGVYRRGLASAIRAVSFTVFNAQLRAGKLIASVFSLLRFAGFFALDVSHHQ